MRYLLLAMICLSLLNAPAFAEWQPDPGDELQVAAAEALQRIRGEHEATVAPFIERAYAYAIYPKLRRGGLLLGYASGEGIVIESGRLAGYTHQRRFSLGPQVGYQAQAQIIFFKDEESLVAFKLGTLEFAPQASATAGSSGGASDGGFSSGVAVFSAADGGLMLEASAGATHYTFREASP